MGGRRKETNESGFGDLRRSLWAVAPNLPIYSRLELFAPPSSSCLHQSLPKLQREEKLDVIQYRNVQKSSKNPAQKMPFPPFLSISPAFPSLAFPGSPKEEGEEGKNPTPTQTDIASRHANCRMTKRERNKRKRQEFLSLRREEKKSR